MPSVGMPVGLAAAAAGGSSDQASPAAVSHAAARLADLAVEAAELDERVAAIAVRERELDVLAASLAEEQIRQSAAAAELSEQERVLTRRAAAVSEQETIVASREGVVAALEAELRAQARLLEERAARFHWRWFLRAWAWRPRRPASIARVCELFLVPSPNGYKLLEQTGVAVTPQAAFDGRWCVYLEIG